MNTFSLLVLAAALGVATVATWAACRWWYGRKLAAAAKRLHKSDQSRLFSQQQAQDARRQIETLKKELSAQRAMVSQTQASQARARELEQQLRDAERAAASALSMPMPLSAPHGFADTQILS